jgi:hypothetical protein
MNRTTEESRKGREGEDDVELEIDFQPPRRICSERAQDKFRKRTIAGTLGEVMKKWRMTLEVSTIKLRI